MNLLTGPLASGKTTRLLEVAQRFLAERKRVWWVCLPAQKAFVYRRATETGAVLGLEVLTSQQVYYRMLAANFRLQPILTGPGRIALTGEALISPGGDLPSPGEARLFARAIAEAKRYGLKPPEVPAASPESRRLQRIFARYEELKAAWGRWDYDDFRSAALELVERGPVTLEADLVIVDGFRELSPLELRFFSALGRQLEVRVSLPDEPEGSENKGKSKGESGGTRTGVYPAPPKVFKAPNPVSEARWIMRSLKRDLALGMGVLEVAVLAPASRIPALLTLADEYGVPLVDQSATTAAETPEGRLLLELLELPDYPTPTRLLAIPDLAPLGKAALERGLVGREAIHRLAAEVGMSGVWTAWLERLEPKGRMMDWAAELMDALPEVRHSPRRMVLLERAKEAERIASGPGFRSWWSALLSETQDFHRPAGGVALLTPTLASGRRWKKLYLCYAVEGAYGSGEREDYFVPEELRQSLEVILQGLRTHEPVAASTATAHSALPPPPSSLLPKRFQGRDRLLLAELQTRAEEVVITYPEASQEGPLEPEPGLLPAPAAGVLPSIPPMPPASVLELALSRRYTAPLGLVSLGKPSVEALKRYSECGLQYWAQQFTEPLQEKLWWRQLVRELRKADKLVPARLEGLARQFPEAEGWLRHHQTRLAELSLGFRLEGQNVEARLDGVLRKGSETHIYRFVEPNLHPEDAEAIVRSRWAERWAAAYLLQAFKGRITQVSLWAWPVLGEPVLVYDRPIEKVWSVLERLTSNVREASSRFQAGQVEPRPGFRCRECRVRDACREGKLG